MPPIIITATNTKTLNLVFQICKSMTCRLIPSYYYQQLPNSLITLTSRHHDQWEASLGAVDQWAVGAAAVVYWPWLDERHVYKVMAEVSVCHNAHGRFEERERRSCCPLLACISAVLVSVSSLESKRERERNEETERYGLLYKTRGLRLKAVLFAFFSWIVNFHRLR